MNLGYGILFAESTSEFTRVLLFIIVVCIGCGAFVCSMLGLICGLYGHWAVWLFAIPSMLVGALLTSWLVQFDAGRLWIAVPAPPAISVLAVVMYFRSPPKP